MLVMTPLEANLKTPEAVIRLRLRLARVSQGMSQHKLASLVGVQQQTISYWEITGNVPGFMLGALSGALDVEMDFWDTRR